MQLSEVTPGTFVQIYLIDEWCECLVMDEREVIMPYNCISVIQIGYGNNLRGFYPERKIKYSTNKLAQIELRQRAINMGYGNLFKTEVETPFGNVVICIK